MKKAKEAEKAIFHPKKVSVYPVEIALVLPVFFFGGGGWQDTLNLGPKKTPQFTIFHGRKSLKLDGMGKMFPEVGRFWETYFVLSLFW